MKVAEGRTPQVMSSLDHSVPRVMTAVSAAVRKTALASACVWTVFAAACGSGARDAHPTTSTIHAILCDQAVTDGRTCPEDQALPLNPTTYRFFPDDERVIVEGWGDISDAVSCSVADSRNWRCDYRDGSGGMEVRAGAYREWSTDPRVQRELERTLHVSPEEHARYVTGVRRRQNGRARD
jgi:hypothetical protein